MALFQLFCKQHATQELAALGLDAESGKTISLDTEVLQIGETWTRLACSLYKGVFHPWQLTALAVAAGYRRSPEPDQ